MSDLRYDPILDCWTVVAENRRDRPIEFVPNEQLRKQLICPFCAGNEDETPPPLALLDAGGDPLDDLSSAAWTARVFPNRYPTFASEKRGGIPPCGPYLRSSGSGAQELVIPTPRHVSSLGELTVGELVAGMIAAQMRITRMMQSADLVHAMLFCNCRFEAGASIEHVHFQLIGSPLASSWLQNRVKRLREHRQQQGQSMLHAIVDFETADRKRIVATNDQWVMLCPLASRMPFQVWIVPLRPARSFSGCSREQLELLARLTVRYVRRLEELLGQPGYNWVLHQSPFADETDGDWFVEIVPRLAKSAGYELGTDVWVNPVSPETAARRLK